MVALSAAALVVGGLFLGCLGTGVVLAYVQDGRGAMKRSQVAINGGFEDENGEFGFGYPSRPACWTGDQSEVVKSGDQGIMSFEGDRMLKLTQTWGEKPERVGSRSNQWQIVDLRSFRNRMGPNSGSLQAIARARFNRVDAGPETDTGFRVEVLSFSGDPATVEKQYDREEYLSSSNLNLISDGDPQTWEEVEVGVSVPAYADFVLVGFFARENIKDDPNDGVEFQGHYVDGVEIELVKFSDY